MRWPLTLLLMAGCSSSSVIPPEPKEAEAPAPKRRSALAVTSEVGALDQNATDLAFRRMEGTVGRCLAEGAESVAALGGDFTLALRIDPEGRVGKAYLSSSTLGHRPTERCILEAARAKRWPHSVGGVAVAEHTFAVDAPIPAAEWDGGRLRPVMQTIRAKLGRCVPTVGGTYQATIYLQRDGRVLAAGVAPPDPAGEERADCVVEVLEGFRFGPQRAALTKVTFEFR